MDWILVLSVSLNIVAALVYFKVPELLQGLLMKKVEYKYNISFDRWKIHHDVLPVLFEKAATAHNYYQTNWDGKKLDLQLLFHYAELKNYITVKQFFLPKEITLIARELENEIHKYIMTKQKVTNESLNRKQLDELDETLEKLIKELENQIYEVLETK